MFLRPIIGAHLPENTLRSFCVIHIFALGFATFLLSLRQRMARAGHGIESLPKMPAASASQRHNDALCALRILSVGGTLNIAIASSLFHFVGLSTLLYDAHALMLISLGASVSLMLCRVSIYAAEQHQLAALQGAWALEPGSEKRLDLVVFPLLPVASAFALT